VINIRDPIHGTVSVTPREIRLVDSPFFQRLRNVKQLGFADLAFPGATHTRYAHSLGAMHVATRLFDVLFPEHQDLLDASRHKDGPELTGGNRARLRQAVRLAVLFHDCGHAPLSHTTERIMPPVSHLRLPQGFAPAADRQATHEDYTLKILVDSELANSLRRTFSDDGITPDHVADLMVANGGPSRWIVDGADFGPVLRQLVSSELDADRMDYLQRDSFYSGVNYGKFDADWLIQNVVPVVDQNQRVHLGIASRAVFGFEDFLLSRYHMFLTVYYHHTPVCFGEMLGRYFDSAPGEYQIPSDVEQYLQHDDMLLWMALRGSGNPWAQRICNRRPFRLIKDDARHQEGGHLDLAARLRGAGIEIIEHTSRGVLSKYFQRPDVAPIYVVEDNGQTTPVESFTPLYRRYSDTVLVHRLYVEPGRVEEALHLA
jgi:HD superfamily phosphohydrolase